MPQGRPNSQIHPNIIASWLVISYQTSPSSYLWLSVVICDQLPVCLYCWCVSYIPFTSDWSAIKTPLKSYWHAVKIPLIRIITQSFIANQLEIIWLYYIYIYSGDHDPKMINISMVISNKYSKGDHHYFTRILLFYILGMAIININ